MDLRLISLLKKTLFLLLLLASLFWACGSIRIKNIQTVPTEENWTLYGGDPSRANYRDETLAPPLEHIWTYKATSAPGKTLTVANGLIYFVTLDGRLDVVNIENGKRFGRLKTEGHFEATCAFYENDLVIASRYGNKTLTAYNLEQGKHLWKINAGDIASEPLVTSEGIFVSALYNHIDKYRLETGERIWTFKSEGQHHSSPALSQNTLVVGCDNGNIYALNAEKGTLKWEVTTGASIFATPIIKDEKVFVGSSDSVFYSLNLEDGEIFWEFQADRPIYETAATDGERVVFGASNGQVYCLDFESGEEVWSFKAKSLVSTAPLISGDVVFFGSLDRHYYCLDLRNGNELWSFETKGRIRTSPVLWGKYVIGASEDRFLYAF
ncbi:PQQ-like beta-propeller repeat protein, partial [candidate division KSB1 bacterium]|nr:PQQ-like beta-propeller repeat protein [candidate division KSB1 bacterium]